MTKWTDKFETDDVYKLMSITSFWIRMFKKGRVRWDIFDGMSIEDLKKELKKLESKAYKKK